MGITSDQAAQMLGIAGGSLRQIETNAKPASLALAFRAEALYGVPVDDLIDEAKDDPEPKPKPQPKIERVAPPRRQEREPTKGPKRATNGTAA